jgi:zinc transport system substrate-binding protein
MIRHLLTAALLTTIATSTAHAELNVIASIRPIHSLVSAVMKDVGAPALIVDGANSPHTYTLKPSDAEALSKANVVFWVGDELEAFLKKPLKALSSNATTVSLIEIDGVKTLPTREGDGFEAHEDHDAHAHEEHDAHIWLDPENAKAIVRKAAEVLATADAGNATKYRANAEATLARIDTLSAEIASSLKGNTNKFIVFHDAYQYFEKRFNMPASGAISIHPENPPGAKAIRAIRNRLTSENIACVYAEPQFDTKLVNIIIEGTEVKTGVLDPEGANLDSGPELYFNLLRNLANNIKGC